MLTHCISSCLSLPSLYLCKWPYGLVSWIYLWQIHNICRRGMDCQSGGCRCWPCSLRSSHSSSFHFFTGNTRHQDRFHDTNLRTSYGHFGQIVGVVIGSIVNPCIFLAFEKNEKPGVTIGSAQSHFPCPFAGFFRAIGVIGTGGVKELPAYCLAMCLAAFFVTVFIDALTIASQRKGWRLQNYLPNMTAVALPFFAGPDFAIDMCIGSGLLFLWTKMNSRSAEFLSAAVAAGLICGGLFALPSAVLTMFSVQPPMCMRFFPSGKEVDVIDSFLHTLDTASKT